MCLKFSQSDSLCCTCESDVSDIGSPSWLEVIFSAAANHLCLLPTSRAPVGSTHVLILRLQSPLSSGSLSYLPTYSIFGLRLPDIFCRLQSRTLNDTNCVNHLKWKSSKKKKKGYAFNPHWYHSHNKHNTEPRVQYFFFFCYSNSVRHHLLIEAQRYNFHTIRSRRNSRGSAWESEGFHH